MSKLPLPNVKTSKEINLYGDETTEEITYPVTKEDYDYIKNIIDNVKKVPLTLTDTLKQIALNLMKNRDMFDEEHKNFIDGFAKPILEEETDTYSFIFKENKIEQDISDLMFEISKEPEFKEYNLFEEFKKYIASDPDERITDFINFLGCY